MDKKIDANVSQKAGGISDHGKMIGINIEELNATLSYSQARPRPGSAPPMPPLVIGREDALADLKARLGIKRTGEPGGAVQVLTAIRGWPGVGKTTIAAQLAHDNEVTGKFPDGTLWVSLGPAPNLFSELATWGAHWEQTTFCEPKPLKKPWRN